MCACMCTSSMHMCICGTHTHVSMYVCACTCIFHAHVYLCGYTHTCLCMCMYLHMCAFIRVRLHVCVALLTEKCVRAEALRQEDMVGCKDLCAGLGVRGQMEGVVWRLGCENPVYMTKSFNVFLLFPNLCFSWSIIAFQCCIHFCHMTL